jgi:hypothetical protein
VTPPADHLIDGIDLMPLLKGGTMGTDRNLHWLFGDSWAIRKGPWKLMGEGKNPLVLVNLEKDLPENGNLIKDQPGLVGELLKLHQQWIEAVGNR